jgi:hypothetical protein
LLWFCYNYLALWAQDIIHRYQSGESLYIRDIWILLRGRETIADQYYYFCSAKNYAGLNNELEVILLDLF